MYYEKKCKICGKIFHTKRYLNQFCSQSCYFKSKRQERNLEKVKRIKERNPELSPLLVDGYVRYKHKCSFCGKEYISPATDSKYCSKVCYRRQLKGLADKKRLTEETQERKEKAEFYKETFYGKALKFRKVCPVCGNEFVAAKTTTVFCSSRCAKGFRLSQEREQRAKKVTEQDVLRQIAAAKNSNEYGEYLRPNEVASYLGLGRATVFRYIKSGIIKVSALPGATLVHKDSLDELLRQGIVFKRGPASVRRMPDVELNPVVELSGEYISIADAAKAYDLPLNVAQNSLRRSGLDFVRFRNVRFYKRIDVDRFLRSREKSRHPEIEQWYTVEEIMANYGMERRSVYNFVFSKQIPKKKDGNKAKYSKKHVDDILSNTGVVTDDYYTAEQIEAKYSFDKRRLYKIISRIGIPKLNLNGKLWVEKKAFDDLMALNSVP